MSPADSSLCETAAAQFQFDLHCSRARAIKTPRVKQFETMDDDDDDELEN